MVLTFRNPGTLLYIMVLLIVAIGVALFFRLKKEKDKSGIKAANTKRLRKLTLYRVKRIESILLRVFFFAGLGVGLLSSVLLFVRPYKSVPDKDDFNGRDIMLCIDISASNYSGIADLTDELIKTVEGLDGDRIGISLFNTSSVLYLPVTDDYKFAIKKLTAVSEYFKAEEAFQKEFGDKYEYTYEIPESERDRYDELNATLSAFDQGTTAGYEIKGTSCVGEGLASALFSFPELMIEKRTRTLILITDNEPEYIQDELVSLEDACQMCVADDVTVFGIYPGTDIKKYQDGSQRRAEFKSAVEEAGGKFYEKDAELDAERILDDIQAQSIKDTELAVSTKTVDNPTGWFIILCISLGIAFLCVIISFIETAFLTFKNKKLYQKIVSIIMAVLIITCVVCIGIRPMMIDENSDIRTNNLDVCFIVDTTISMWAEDYNKAPRMEGVKKDIETIINALPGSSFALVSFDNSAQLLMPYTKDINGVRDAVDDLSMPNYSTAQGSSINKIYDEMKQLADVSDEKKGERRTIYFIFSDGETTDGTKLMDFSKLEKEVDGGAVIGYGCSKGGKMNYPGKGYVKDTSKGISARSYIDEDNLQDFAKKISVPYIHSGTVGYNNLIFSEIDVIKALSRDAAIESGDTTGMIELYYYFAGVLALFLTAWLIRDIYKGGLS